MAISTWFTSDAFVLSTLKVDFVFVTTGVCLPYLSVYTIPTWYSRNDFIDFSPTLEGFAKEIWSTLKSKS